MKKNPKYLDKILYFMAESEVDRMYSELKSDQREKKIEDIYKKLACDNEEQMTAHANPRVK